MSTEKFKAGLCSVSFRQHSPEEILREMKEAELTFIEWGSDVHAPADNEENLLKIADLQAEYGVECSSYGTYFRIGNTPKNELPQYIRAARILGTNVLRLWCGTKGSESFYECEKEAFFNLCRELAKTAKEEDMILAMECHAGTYTDKAASATELMEAVNDPHFRMYWQPNQYRTATENMAQAKALAKYTMNIHAFNWEKSERFSLREAVLVWQNYLKNFSGNETVLLEFMPDDSLCSLRKEADALRDIIAGG